jgi:hypothetical protein
VLDAPCPVLHLIGGMLRLVNDLLSCMLQFLPQPLLQASTQGWGEG